MLPLLAPRPFTLDLGPEVVCVGFAVDDYAGVLRALSGLTFQGEPERAVDKRRAEFLAGRLAAAHALRRLGVAEDPGRNPDGSPRWPSSVVGSITHGARRALAAVGRSAELLGLGIDAESLLAEDASLELKRRICSEREQHVLAAALGLPEHVLVSLAFSAKESLYKSLFPQAGRFMEFAAAEVTAAFAEPARAEPARPGAGLGTHGQLELRLTLDWAPSFLAGRQIATRFFVGHDHVETAVKLAPAEPAHPHA